MPAQAIPIPLHTSGQGSIGLSASIRRWVFITLGEPSVYTAWREASDTTPLGARPVTTPLGARPVTTPLGVSPVFTSLGEASNDAAW